MANLQAGAPDQAIRDKVVNNANTDQFLGASAGSGKTKTLVDHYLHLLMQGVRPAEIIAVTFTEKAAWEMKDRLREECGRLATSAQNSDEQTIQWRQLNWELESAHIGTIHALCRRILGESALAAGLDPGFGILDEAQSGLYIAQVVRKSILERLQADNEGTIRLVFLFGLEQVENVVTDMIKKRAGMLPELSQDYYKNAADLYASWEAKIKLMLPQKIDELFEDERWQSQTATIIGCEGTKDTDKLEQKRRDAAGILIELYYAHDRRDVPVIMSLLMLLQELDTFRGGRAKDWPDEYVFAQVKEAVCSVVNKSGELYSSISDVLQYEMKPCDREAAEITVAMVAEFFAALEAYTVYKEKLQALDFEDLLLRVNDLWQTRPDVLARYQKRYRHVMIDEFQDTNSLQHDVLWALAGHEPVPVNSSCLFVVGDAKQSIYRFRNADVTVFNQTENELKTTGSVDELTAGFRTRKGLTAFINHLFSHPEVMGTHSERPDWEARFTPIVPARIEDTPDGQYDVEINLYYDANKNSDASTTSEDSYDISNTSDTDEPANAPDAVALRLKEARGIAERISELLSSGYQITDKKTKQWKPVQAGDIAILLRAFGDIGLYEFALRDAGIPYYVTSGRGFYSVQEVRDVLSCLSALENTQDEISLVGVLRSPMFGLSDETLYKLAQTPDSWWERVQKCAMNLNLNDAEEQSKLQLAAQALSWLQKNKNQLRLSELVTAILNQTGFSAVLAAQWAGEQKLSNLQKLADLAAKFEQSAGSNLRGFINYINDLTLLQEREGEAPIEEEHGESVKILSIHKSKGLEWPIVFVPDITRSRPNDKGNFRFHAHWGLSTSVPGDDKPLWPVVGLCAKNQNEKEEEAERRRLFYVATTRARELLVITSGVKEKKKKNQQDEEHLWDSTTEKSPAGWLDTVLGGQLKTYPEGEHAITGDDWRGIVRIIRDNETEISTKGTETRQVSLINSILSNQLPMIDTSDTVTLPALAQPYFHQSSLRQLTATAITRYLSDPQEYRQKYNGSSYAAVNSFLANKIPTQLNAAERGEVVHHILRLVGTGGEEVFNRALGEGLGISTLFSNRLDQDMPQIEATVRQFLCSDLYSQLFIPTARLRTEVPVSFMLGDVMIEGKIDALIELTDGSRHLLDYKTGEHSPQNQKEYQIQLGLYCKAIELATGQPAASAQIVYLSPEGIDVSAFNPIELSVQSMEAAESVIQKMRNEQIA